MRLYVSSDLIRGPDRSGNFIAEASELGLAPGQWPQTICTKLGTLNKRFHHFARSLSEDHDLQAVVYLGDGGGKLTVFND